MSNPGETQEGFSGQNRTFYSSDNLLLVVNVRKAANMAVEPTRRDGISSMSIMDNENCIPLVYSADADSFVPYGIEPERLDIDETPQKRFLSILSLSFKKKQQVAADRWKFTDQRDDHRHRFFEER